MNIAALVIFAIVAVIILVQLYSVLGRKVGFRVEDKVLAKPAEDMDGTLKLERPAEAPRLPNLDLLKSRDINFNEINFVEKAREAYEQIVQAYHRGEIDTVKDRLSENVYVIFKQAVENRSAPVTRRLNFVEAPKADIDLIDFKDDTAQIRVRFLSELMFEDIPQPVEAGGEGTAVPEVKEKPEKTYERTAEFWTFQKSLRNPGSPWLLTHTMAAKA
ncbi:Tim44/TimA family putative adaptor protein [Asticcacaulis solisilvae]|uniref:Tim44/TimA family putative adaptor protein n=1 Tax=Asticcacaulis solisilvae TaxID=1217274 RepID=UPI003FD7AB85